MSKTTVAIIGAGPAGLLLSQLLHLDGIDSVVVEIKSQSYVEERIRAGVLEQGTVDILTQTGVGERLAREGMVHHGFDIQYNGQRHRIDLSNLADGKCVTIYGQHEVIKDLIAARLAVGGKIIFDVQDVALHGLDSDEPSIAFVHQENTQTLHCKLIAGCDGFHGICRPSIPAAAQQIYDRQYPFAWLGILAQAAPNRPELIYAQHDRGFALYSMRSPAVTRLYLQCAPDDSVENWSDDRIWNELFARLRTDDGWLPAEGRITQKGVTGMRSFVSSPMQHGNLYLAGDAAHIVPPTGAKGMNLAVADVTILARAISRSLHKSDSSALQQYSAICLRRIWKVQRFSSQMTSMLHNFHDDDAFARQMQLAELDYFTGSEAGRRTIAENYVGLPLP
jgi:p-hydroxybenzoate 3-monooxygenase